MSLGRSLIEFCHAEQHVRHARRRQWIILPRINLSPGSLRCLRRSHAAHVHPRPIEALQKRGQLRRRQTHHAVLDCRPAELGAFEPLDDEADTSAVPEQQLHEPSGTSDQPDHLEIVDVIRDDMFTVLFQKNGVRYVVYALPEQEAWLTEILKTCAVHRLATRQRHQHFTRRHHRNTGRDAASRSLTRIGSALIFMLARRVCMTHSSACHLRSPALLTWASRA